MDIYICKNFNHLRACTGISVGPPSAPWCSLPPRNFISPKEISPRKCVNLTKALHISIKEEKSTLFLGDLGFLPFTAFLGSIMRLVLALARSAAEGAHQKLHSFRSLWTENAKSEHPWMFATKFEFLSKALEMLSYRVYLIPQLSLPLQDKPFPRWIPAKGPCF